MKIANRLLLTFTLSAIACGFSKTSQAATIAWNFSEIVSTGGAGNTTGTGFLATSGSFIYAENTGGGASSLDGISFAAGTILFSGSQTFNAFHNNTTTSPITSTAAYGPTGAETVTVGLGGVGGSLVIGQTYRIQAIVMDGRGNFANRTFEVDGLATDHALGTSGVTWGNALLATGTFVADSTSQSFSLEVINANATSAGPQLNGLVLHAIPEPSTGALFGLAGLALILRRKRA